MLALQNPWFCWIPGRQWTISSSLFEDNSPDWSTRIYLSRALLLLEPYCAWDWSWLTNICSTSYWNGSQFNSCETWIIRWMVWKPAGASIFFRSQKVQHFNPFQGFSFLVEQKIYPPVGLPSGNLENGPFMEDLPLKHGKLFFVTIPGIWSGIASIQVHSGHGFPYSLWAQVLQEKLGYTTRKGVV